MPNQFRRLEPRLATIAKTGPDTPLSLAEVQCTGLLLANDCAWRLALIRGVIAYATTELRRDVTASTKQSVAKMKHFMRCLISACHVTSRLVL